MHPTDTLMNEIMAHMGFEPYEGRYGMGWFRYIKAVKSGLLGEIGSYFLHDYILIEYPPLEELLSKVVPIEDVMSQRIALISDEWSEKVYSKSFWFGLKGFVEIAYIAPHEKGAYAPKRFRDLSYIWHVATNTYVSHR